MFDIYLSDFFETCIFSEPVAYGHYTKLMLYSLRKTLQKMSDVIIETQ